jgi:UDPglucose 6-dehydrogenase
MAVNARRPEQFGKLTEEALGSLRGATLAVFGLAFKPGTDDLRESASLAVIKYLAAKGATIRTYDPIVTSATQNGFPAGATPCSTPEEALTGADAALMLTACAEFYRLDWSTLCARMHQQIILDGRNAFEGVSWPPTVRYISIGRAIEHAKIEETRLRMRSGDLAPLGEPHD